MDAQRLIVPGPKRILALDGGGVRGVLSLAILERIESLPATATGRTDGSFRLAHYYDLIRNGKGTPSRSSRRRLKVSAGVGYSRLMGRDESGTLARCKAQRTKRLEPALAWYGGRLVKLHDMGT